MSFLLIHQNRRTFRSTSMFRIPQLNYMEIVTELSLFQFPLADPSFLFLELLAILVDLRSYESFYNKSTMNAKIKSLRKSC